MSRDPDEDRPPPESPGGSRLWGKAGDVVAGLGGVVIGCLMLLTVLNVFLRATGGGSVPGIIEVTEVALVAVVYLGMTPAETDRVHVRTPILVGRLHGMRRRVAKVAGMALAAALTGFVTWATLRAGLASFASGEYRFGLLSVPVWPAKLLVPVGMAGLTFALLARLVRIVRGLPDQPPGEGVEEDYAHPL